MEENKTIETLTSGLLKEIACDCTRHDYCRRVVEFSRKEKTYQAGIGHKEEYIFYRICPHKHMQKQKQKYGGDLFDR